jgi:RNA polymerase sigma-70 factor, ECF subfamily
MPERNWKEAGVKTTMDFVAATEVYRPELLAHCYRLTGSLHDAEDLVQDTMLRAWRSADAYDPSRASLRTWLYRIATNVCLTALASHHRRSLPAGLSGASTVTDVGKLEAREDVLWLEPFPDALRPASDPAAIIESRDSIRLAFIAALQYLPPRQRAVLILRDVLAMPAAETAELLEITVASVNSALQRARGHLAAADPSPDGLAEPDDAAERDLLGRYMAAMAAMDVEALKQTLREDALLQMPPFPAWFSGRDAIAAFMSTVFARDGSFRCVLTRANGQRAIGLYKRRPDDEAYWFLHIQVFTFGTQGIARIDGFHDKRLAAVFGLPQSLPSRHSYYAV